MLPMPTKRSSRFDGAVAAMGTRLSAMPPAQNRAVWDARIRGTSATDSSVNSPTLAPHNATASAPSSDP